MAFAKGIAAGTLRWARGQEGRFDAPLSSSGLHLPLTKKGLLAPFKPQSRRAPYKKASRFAQRFFVFRHLKSLRDGRRPTAATAVCRCDPSREKVTPKSPRLRSNESPSGAFKRQNGLALARWRSPAPTSSADFSNSQNKNNISAEDAQSETEGILNRYRGNPRKL